MNKPKKAKVAPSEKIATKQKEPTPIKSVKVKEVKENPRPLRKGDTFLFVKDGQDVYYTRSTANVVFQRNSASMVIPKGSDYIPPKGSKCDGCE